MDIQDVGNSFRQGTVLIFLGAGMSAPLGYPPGPDLARDLRLTFQHRLEAGARRSVEGIPKLSDTVEELESAGVSRAEIEGWIRTAYKPDEAKSGQNPYLRLRQLIERSSATRFLVFTTNWDRALEHEFTGSSVNYLRDVKDASSLVAGLSKEGLGRVTIVKLHGDVMLSGSLVLTDEDARRALDLKKPLYNYLAGALVDHRALFLGYRLDDPDIETVCGAMRPGAPAGTDYLVVKQFEPASRLADFKKRFPSVEVISNLDVCAFLDALGDTFGGLAPGSINLPLEVDRAVCDLIAKGKSVVVSASKYGGKTSMVSRLRSSKAIPANYAVADIPDDALPQDFEALLSILRWQEEDSTNRRLVVLITDHVRDYFDRLSRERDGFSKGLLRSFEYTSVNLSVTQEEGVLLLGRYLAGPEFEQLASSPEFEAYQKKVLQESTCSFGLMHKTVVPAVLRALSTRLRQDPAIQLAVKAAKAGDPQPLNRALEKKVKELDVFRVRKERLQVALGVEAAAFLGLSLKTVEEGAQTFAGIASLIPGIGWIPMAGALGIAAFLLGRRKVKGEGERQLLAGLSEASQFYEELTYDEREFFCYEIERKGRLTPGSAHPFLDWLLVNHGERAIDGYFARHPEVWDQFAGSEAGKRLLSTLTSEIEPKVEQRFTELKTEVNRLDKDVESLRSELTDLLANWEGAQVLLGLYHRPESLGLTSTGKDWRLTSRLIGQETTLTQGGPFEDYATQICEACKNGTKVIVTGARGSGKSILTRYALARQLFKGALTEVIDYTVYQGALAEAVDDDSRVVLFDPMSPELYARSTIELGMGQAYTRLQQDLRPRLNDLMASPMSAVIVLPDEQYREYFEPEPTTPTGNANRVIIHIKLDSPEFIGGLLAAYSVAPVEARLLGTLTSALTSFESSHALIATYVGRWLGHPHESPSTIENAIQQSKSKPIAFLQYYVWHGVLGGNAENARSMAAPLLVHVALNELVPPLIHSALPMMAPENARLLPTELPGGTLRPLEEGAAQWISRRQEDLIEEALRSLVLDAAEGTGLRGLKDFHNALQDAATIWLKVDRNEVGEWKSAALNLEFSSIRRRLREAGPSEEPLVLQAVGRSLVWASAVGLEVPPKTAVRRFCFNDQELTVSSRLALLAESAVRELNLSNTDHTTKLHEAYLSLVQNPVKNFAKLYDVIAHADCIVNLSTIESVPKSPRPPAGQIDRRLPHSVSDAAKVFFRKGNNLFEKNDFDGAKEAYSSALSIDPGFVGARFNRGLTNLLSNRLADAKEDFERISKSVPGDADAWFLLGQIAGKEGRKSEAIVLLRRALRIDPGMQDACKLLEKFESFKGPDTLPSDSLIRVFHVMAVLPNFVPAWASALYPPLVAPALPTALDRLSNDRELAYQVSLYLDSLFDSSPVIPEIGDGINPLTAVEIFLRAAVDLFEKLDPRSPRDMRFHIHTIKLRLRLFEAVDPQARDDLLETMRDDMDSTPFSDDLATYFRIEAGTLLMERSGADLDLRSTIEAAVSALSQTSTSTVTKLSREYLNILAEESGVMEVTPAQYVQQRQLAILLAEVNVLVRQGDIVGASNAIQRLDAYSRQAGAPSVSRDFLRALKTLASAAGDAPVDPAIFKSLWVELSKKNIHPLLFYSLFGAYVVSLENVNEVRYGLASLGMNSVDSPQFPVNVTTSFVFLDLFAFLAFRWRDFNVEFTYVIRHVRGGFASMAWAPWSAAALRSFGMKTDREAAKLCRAFDESDAGVCRQFVRHFDAPAAQLPALFKPVWKSAFEECVIRVAAARAATSSDATTSSLEPVWEDLALVQNLQGLIALIAKWLIRGDSKAALEILRLRTDQPAVDRRLRRLADALEHGGPESEEFVTEFRKAYLVVSLSPLIRLPRPLRPASATSEASASKERAGHRKKITRRKPRPPRRSRREMSRRISSRGRRRREHS